MKTLVNNADTNKERKKMKVKKKVLVKKPKAEKSLDQKNTNILGKFFFILTAVSS